MWLHTLAHEYAHFEYWKKNFKKNTTDENDNNLHITINVYLEESIGNMIKNRIVLNWSIFGALFVLDDKKMYNEYVNKLNEKSQK